MTSNETLETENLSETPVSHDGSDRQDRQDGTQNEALEHVHEGDGSRDQATAPQATLNPELMREVAVEVDADTVSKAFRTVVKRYQKLARIPGFRVGKVPETVIKSRFAK